MRMREAVAAVGTAWLVAAALSAQQQGPPKPDEPQQPLFRGGARFVRVDVFPTGRDGRPVEGLTAADFEMFEDGKRQEIDSFEFVAITADSEEVRVDPNSQRDGDDLARDPRARLFVVVLDKWHVDLIGGARIRRPLIDMLDRLIGPRDVFGVITTQDRPSDLILGRKAISVTDMLQRHWTWGSNDSITARDAVEEYFSDCYGDPRQDPRMKGEIPYWDPMLTRELLLRARERETLDHLDGLVTRLGAIRDEKKAVVIVTQGWSQFRRDEGRINTLGVQGDDGIPKVVTGTGRVMPRHPQTGTSGGIVSIADCHARAIDLLMMDSRQAFKDLLRKAQAANVSFYPVDPRGLAVSDTSLAQRPPPGHGPGPSLAEDAASLRAKRDGLMELSENTDGMAFINNNDLAATLRTFADSLSRYYLLGYYSTNTKFDGGYRRLEVKVKRPGITLKARRGYFAPTQEEIDAMASSAGAPAAASAEAVALSTALGRLEELRHDRDLFVQAARVSGGAVIVSAELGVNARTSRAWTDGGEVRVTLSTPAGDIVETRPIQPLRSGVSMRLPAGHAGEMRVDVRARAKSPGPSSAADASASIRPSAGSLIGDVLSYRGLARALQPAADGRYRRTERVTIEAPLAAGAVPAGARVLDRQGSPLNVPITARERIDAEGVHWLVGELTLAPLAEGDYVIEIEATKDETRERKLFAIRVVR